MLEQSKSSMSPLISHDAPKFRPDLSDLKAEDIAPLERMFEPATPDHWRDLARSQYLTLRTLFNGRYSDTEIASLAMSLTRGIAADLGGTQPYITAGSQLLASARARQVIDLLNQGRSYRDVAQLCGKITEARVRQIESAWVREQRAARQGTLELT